MYGWGTSLRIAFLLFLSTVAHAGVKIHIIDKDGKVLSEVAPTPVNEIRKCPDTMKGWNDWRANLKTMQDFEFFKMEMRFFYDCMSEKDQEKFTTNTEFVACMDRIFYTAEFILLPEENPQEKDWEERKESDFFPDAIRDKAVRDKMSDPTKREAVIREIYGNLPGFRLYGFDSDFPTVHGNHFFAFEYRKGNETHIVNVDFGSQLPYNDSPPQVFNGMVIPDDETKQVKFFGYRANELSFNLDKNKKLTSYTDTGYYFSNNQKQQVTCGACHITGFNPVLKDGKAPTPDIADFNKRHTKNRKTFLGAIEKTASVAPFGERNPKTKEEILNACYPKASPASREKVANAMNCARCHVDDGKANALRGYDSDFFTTINYFLTQGNTMPPKSNIPHTDTFMNPEERTALYECLMTSYFGRMHTLPGDKKANVNGTMIDFLLEKKCPDS